MNAQKLTVAKWQAKEGNELTAKGLVRINSNKPEYGSIMLLHVTMALSNGFLNKKTKVGFVTGRVEDLEGMIDTYKLKEGDDFSEKVAPHRIITSELVESEVPENQGYREKINPSTGEVLTKNGEPIYWKTEVVPAGSDRVDETIEHDRVSAEADAEEAQATQEFEGAAQRTTK